MHSKHISPPSPSTSLFCYFPIVSFDCFISQFMSNIHTQSHIFIENLGSTNDRIQAMFLFLRLNVLIHTPPFSSIFLTEDITSFFFMAGEKVHFGYTPPFSFFKKIEFYMWVLCLHHFQPSLSHQLLPCPLKSMTSSLLLHTTHTHTPHTINLLNLFSLACLCTCLLLTTWD